MNVVLIRRLVGAAVLLALAFVIAQLLPDPSTPAKVEDGIKVVEVDLDHPQATLAEPPTPTVDTGQGLKGKQIELAPPVEPPPASPEITADELEEPDAPAVESKAVAERPKAPGPQATTPPKSVVTPDTKPQVPKPAPEVVKPSATEAKPAVAKPAPAPQAPSRAESSAKPPPVPAAAPPAGDWYVQAGSYSDIANARQVEAQLKSLGYPGSILLRDVNGATYYRVRCGPFSSREAAEAAKGRVASAKLPAQVVKAGD